MKMAPCLWSKKKKYNVIKCDVQKYEMILKALTDRQTDRQTLCKSTTDLHGTVPLAVLAGKELVVCLQSVAFIAEVLDDRFMGEVVTWRWVAAVAPILRFSGWQTSWDKSKSRFKKDPAR